MTAAANLILAALRPHPNRRRCLKGDLTYCPLCGFLLADDLDGHFAPCFIRYAVHADVAVDGGAAAG